MKKITKIIIGISLFLLVACALWVLFLYQRSTLGKSAVSSEYGNRYFKDSKNVYYQYGYLIDACEFPICYQSVPLVKKLESADPALFKPVKEARDFYEDKNSIFFFGERKVNVDRQTFEPMKGEIASCQMSLFKDKKNVYFVWFEKMTIVPSEDPESLQALSCHFLSDNKHIFSFSQADNMGPVVLPKADVATFELLSYDYAKDKNYAYFEGKPIDGADGLSFQSLLNQFAKDKNHVYYTGKILEGVDPLSARAVPGKTLIADANNVYDPISCWNHDKEKCSQKIDIETKELINKYSSVKTQSLVSEDELVKFPEKDTDFFPTRNKEIEKDGIVGAYDIAFVPEPKLEGGRMETLYLLIEKNSDSKTNDAFEKIITPNPAYPNPAFVDIQKTKLGNTEYVKYLSSERSTIHYKSFSKDFYIDMVAGSLDGSFSPEGIRKIENFISGISLKIE